MIGLAHLYPALAWSICAPGHHGYPRAPDLILRKALRGRLGHQITGTTARPFLHFRNPTRRPQRVSFSFAWWCQGSALRLNPSAYAVLGSIVRIDLAVGRFEVSVRDQAGTTMPGAGDVDHVEVVLLDDPVQVHIDEIQTWRRSPVAEEPWFNVLLCERLLEQRIVVEIDLADREVVGRPPVRIHQCPLLIGKRAC